jgi:hypothetical protein
MPFDVLKVPLQLFWPLLKTVHMQNVYNYIIEYHGCPFEHINYLKEKKKKKILVTGCMHCEHACFVLLTLMNSGLEQKFIFWPTINHITKTFKIYIIIIYMKHLNQSECNICSQYLWILTANIDCAICFSVTNIFGCISENIHHRKYLVFAFILIVSEKLWY